ncbi:hypothetical protein [Spirosoma luteum]|nr:hypothetical protein [Spirosoma luteum]
MTRTVARWQMAQIGKTNEYFYQHSIIRARQYGTISTVTRQIMCLLSLN